MNVNNLKLFLTGVIAFLSIQIGTCQQLGRDSFIIKGTVHGRDTGTVFFYTEDISKPWRSTKLDHGNFLLKGQVDFPDFFNMGINDDVYLNSFFISNNKVISIDYDAVRHHFEAAGNSENEIYFQFKKNIKPYLTRQFELKESAKKFEGNLKAKAEIFALIKENGDKIFKEGQMIILSYPDNLATAQILFEIGFYGDPEETKKLTLVLKPEVKSHPLYLIIAKQLAIIESQVNISSFSNFKKYAPLKLGLKNAGKILVVDFWASWCAPCIEEFGLLKTISQAWDTSKVSLIAISLDKNKEDWEKAYKKYNLTNQNYLVSSFNGIDSAFNITSIPYKLIVSPDGKILKARFGIDELYNYLSTNNLLSIKGDISNKK